MTDLAAYSTRRPAARGIAAMLPPLALATATALGACGGRDDRSPATTRVVTIRAFAYAPEPVIAQLGDTLEWRNDDLVPHTATAVEGGGFDSGELATQGRWRHVPTRVGTYSYRCAFHPDMKGELVVR